MGANTGIGQRPTLSTITQSSSRKRKLIDCTDRSHSTDSKYNAHTLVHDGDTQSPPIPKKARKAMPTTAPKEKRLRRHATHPHIPTAVLITNNPPLRTRFRPEPPKSFHELYHRATTQRFYVLSRARGGTPDCPEETVELTGSTGNIYTVLVAPQPRCDCPYAARDGGGHQCKHVVYVLAKVLRARFEYVYQLALLSAELREIFAGAPPVLASGDGGDGGDGGDAGNGGGRRKPVEGDCPICFCEMEAKGTGAESVVWCRAACGQNVHKGCFETWAATKRRQPGGGGNGEVTCPYCRSVWEGDAEMVKTIERSGKPNAEGYVNVASQLGISTQRGEFLCPTGTAREAG